MNDILPVLTPMLLIACIVLLVILLVRQGSLIHTQEKNRLRQEHGLENLGNQLLDELDIQNDRMTDRLQQTNANIISNLSQLGQSQTGLLESMQRQILLSTRNQEEGARNMRLENERQLSELRRAVDQRLADSLDKKLDQSFSQVSERLESVYRGLGEMHTLAAGVGDIKKVLTNVKTRGVWGEMQLGALIRQTLSPGQYEENVAVVPGSAERVEFALRLPDKSGSLLYLPIDSKFPQEDYIRLVDTSQAGDVSGAESARKALMSRIRAEAKKIADKYIAPPHTTDFAIMFLPVEGIYAEVMQSPEAVEAIQRELRVVIAGPGTFSAMLNALQMGFRTLAIEKRSGEVWTLLGEIKSDFGRFAQLLEDTRRRLEQAGESIDSAVTRTRTIRKKLDRVETDTLPENGDSLSLDIPSESLKMKADEAPDGVRTDE